MPADYFPVPQETSDVEEKDFSLSNAPIHKRTHPSELLKHTLLIIVPVLACSIAANLFCIYRQFVTPWELSHDLPTQFGTGLRRDIPIEILSGSNFDSPNRTIQDAAWGHVDVEPWNGFVALDENYAIAQGLPHSQRWPWDLSKGVYIMTSSHELHCVHVLRESVNEDYDGVPEAKRMWHYPHLMHCLNVLRESIMCNADDTPLYIGRLHKNVHEKSPRAGTGTIKMCRDWNKLLEWSRGRSACYRPVHWTEGGFREIDRYKTCPDGAKPWEQMEGM
ncbi:hypothetical protein F4779DRAFT_632940 [Xylariaceae sp. FL0662B]|nr:hypothetical protein F4779DRAFT_632940 [Xylariaceae sp. FL0662B]